uniref:GK21463 n=1 Tax=Drosophila willistoni TaxID=7260 RepID=B4MQ92_DROWI
MCDAPVKGPLIGVRHLQIGLLFMCIFVSNFSNVNVAISLVAMTDAASANPNQKSNRSQWQIIFGITALIYICGSIIYIKWGSAETQPWNDVDYLKRGVYIQPSRQMLA